METFIFFSQPSWFCQYRLVSTIKPCKNVRGQYNETADSSLSQLWLLWSLDYYNWTTASYTNH